jgi:hypothetical protein
MAKKQNIIRLTESELRSMIQEAVKQNLNEIGETEKGQRALGALAARKKLAYQPTSNISKYAEKARGGDNWKLLSYPNGTIEGVNPLYPSFIKGYKDYLDSHPDEITSYYKMKEPSKRHLSDEANWTNNIVTEAFSDIVQHNHIMANNEDMYDAYVLIDNSDDALIGNYNDMNDAIEDADYYARNNKYGSYSVVGCIDNTYDLNDEKSIIYTAG